MSLLQELEQGGNSLAERYNEPKMAQIIDEYCKEIINTKIDKSIADLYVLEADAQRYYHGELEHFNVGHVYSGIMYNADLNNRFIDWYKANYLTYEDLHDHYDEISECISKNIDPRMENVVITELISNGMKNYDEQSVRDTFEKIDEDERNRNRSIQTDENGRKYFDATPSKEFLKAIVRCCYKLARDFEPLQIAKYISGELSIVYDKPVKKSFYFDDDSKVVTVSANNNIDMVASLENAMTNALLYLNPDDEDRIYELFDCRDCDIEINNTYQVFTVAHPSDELADDNMSLDADDDLEL
jgi:hypothetical protein